MSHMRQIGDAGYFGLIQTKAQIQNHCQHFGFDTPAAINDPACNTPATCNFTWSREWDTTVSKLIHHPDVPMSCIDLLNLLEETEIDDLCEGCGKRTVSWVWGTGHATKEEDLIDAAVTALMSLQIDEPIRAALMNVNLLCCADTQLVFF
ncbi:hypothetical protein B0H17DRAFT_1215170 [Mycena rosella]|uniref:Uncharacterized protein n=1 Tax=Mycena rosella TaxID=1033263 RepID=A0AAD7CLB2_MYCRO|nr:hypothetical protein B0H17DRAFT_1215170 [Mycena rosella]